MRIGDDRDPFVILGNIPELSAVFETKARAPFKIVFEVCRLSELVEEAIAEEKKAQADAAGAGVTDQEKAKEEVKVKTESPTKDSGDQSQVVRDGIEESKAEKLPA